MKAIAVFPQTREVKLIDHPEPKLTSPTEVRLKILNVGVCGTDREIWSLDYGTPPEGSPYLITGHESFGQVVEVGKAVTTFKVGDYAVPTVRRGCPENCISCANGQPDFCFTGHFTERGIKMRHGYMTEYVVDEERYMNRVPPELKDVAVLLEPLTITEKALMQVNTIQSRLHWECRIDRGVTDKSCHTAVVLGAGPVGILGAMALRNLNMTTYVVAREPGIGEKGDLIRSIGATYFSTQKMSVDEIAARTGNIDLILEATGAASVSYDFMRVLGVNGIFIFTGVPSPHKDITIDAGTLMRNAVLKNQVVVGTVNAPKAAFENGIRDLQEFGKRWPKETQKLITSRVPFPSFDLKKVARHPAEIKTILTFN